MKKGHSVPGLIHVLLLTVLAVPGPAMAQLYQCIAANGETTLSDEPCGGNAVQIRLEVLPQPAPTALQPLLANGQPANPAPPPPVSQVTTASPPLDPIGPRTDHSPGSNPGIQHDEPQFSVNAMLRTIGGYSDYVIGYFLALPLLAWTLGRLPGHGVKERPPFRYIYSTLTYLVTIPGTFSAVLVGYSLFFVHQNLLTVNALSYFLPILSMIATLVLIGKKVDFNRLPGFDRLAGLIVLIATTFVILLLLYKTMIFIGFFAHMSYLIPVGIFLFLLLNWGTRKLF